MKAYIKNILSWVPWVILGLLISAFLAADTYNADDPPKKKKEPVADTTEIQKEQMELQMEQVSRMSKWDSLLLKQDTLIKKK